MLNALRNFWMDEEGATAVEYAVLVAVIAVGIATGLKGTGAKISGLIESSVDAVDDVVPD